MVVSAGDVEVVHHRLLSGRGPNPLSSECRERLSRSAVKGRHRPILRFFNATRKAIPATHLFALDHCRAADLRCLSHRPRCAATLPGLCTRRSGTTFLRHTDVPYSRTSLTAKPAAIFTPNPNHRIDASDDDTELVPSPGFAPSREELIRACRGPTTEDHGGEHPDVHPQRRPHNAKQTHIGGSGHARRPGDST